MPTGPSLQLAAFSIAVTAALAPPALAQNAPPIKPGLWEMKMDQAADPARNAQMAKAMEAMAKLPPEQRAKMEAMLKEKGVSMAGDGAIRVCLTKDMLERDAWQQHDEGCKASYTQRTASVWAWKAACPTADIDGVATFAGPERYAVKTTIVSRRQGKDQQTHRFAADARWVGADCGSVKPLATKR